MIKWMYYPRSSQAPALSRTVIEAFEGAARSIDSARHDLGSDEVLAKVALGLSEGGFRVEIGKKRIDKVTVPVLFGLNGKPEKSFDADAYHEPGGFVVEVEAGRAVVNNQFLRDLFKACMMHEVKYLAVAVRHVYKKTNDFQQVCLFFETLYASNRLQLPLNGILVIGY